MTGVAKRTSPRADFLGSSTGVAFRGLTVGLGVCVPIKFVFREAGARGVLFAAAEVTATGGVTGGVAGEELAAATETSVRETGLETEGVGSVAGEIDGRDAVELPPSNPEIAFPGCREYQTPPATSRSEAAMPRNRPVFDPEEGGSAG